MEKYRHLQLKLTPQRLAILKYLEGNKLHPSAEDIYKAVTREFPTMSFATVYNTLEALKSKGNVQELKIDSGKKRYDPDTSKHHHIICTKCRHIVDIFRDFRITLPDNLANGYDVTSNSIEFFGICEKCRS